MADLLVRRPRLGWPVVAGVAMISSAVVVAGVVNESLSEATPDLPTVCRSYERLKSHLGTGSLGDQVGVRAAAAQLADLAIRYPEHPQPGSDPVSTAGPQIIQVLVTPYASARDLLVALCPVAYGCGDGAQCRLSDRLDVDRNR